MSIKKGEKTIFTGYKCRIYPSKEQEALIQKTFGCVRFVYNAIIKETEEHYLRTGKHVSVNPSKYSKVHHFLKEVDSLAISDANNATRVAYDKYFKNLGEKPKLKTPKTAKKSYSTSNLPAAQNIRIKDGHIKLPKVGLVPIVLHREIPEGYLIKKVTVSQSPSGKYYASIQFNTQKEAPPLIKPENFAGLDYSINQLFICSEGDESGYSNHVVGLCDKLKKEQRKLERCRKGSENYKKQYIKVSKIREKISQCRKDHLNKITSHLADIYDYISVEDLSMIEMAKQVRLNFQVKDTSYYEFTRQLEYKLARQGKCLKKVSRWYKSSKTCSVCGNVKDSLNLSERVYRCEKCGAKIDRDINAAINIREEGKREYLESIATSKPAKEHKVKGVKVVSDDSKDNSHTEIING